MEKLYNDAAGNDASPTCPRCGGQMNPKASLNALSRYRDVHICAPCGTDEALRDFADNPLPFREWAEVRNKLADGQDVYEITVSKTASVLVVAASGYEAMAIADAMPDTYYQRQTAWESTDFTETDRDDGRPA